MKLIPHPAVQILIWAVIALLAQHLPAWSLLILSLVLFGVALGLCAVALLSLLRRTRWILLSLLLIYAYTTPGVALFSALGVASPTYEGLSDGLQQLGRLLCVLSGLAILLASLSSAQLISGIYALVYPLCWIGLSRERIAVRLALTLRYAEPTMRDTASNWRATIRDAMQPCANGAAYIELQRHAPGAVDAILVVLSVAMLIGVW